MLSKNEILQERYRIVRQLGHGGMGAVYEAIDERFGEPIALKEILISSVNEAQRSLISKAFEREAKSLAKARHEVIPYVRDYFSESDRQFLVMELVEGDDLSAMLEKRGKPFPIEEVLKWIDQLLDALDYLHNLKPPIIHRDIKPQNLKLNFRRKIKLLDFGIAKSGDKFSTITNQTFVGATLDYSPIEQILRVIDAAFREFILLKHKEKAEIILKQNTDVRCDIYSVGATFYHLLTNQLPQTATRRILAIWEDKNDPLLNPSELNPEIPEPISTWLLKAMEIERDNRFSSAIEMQNALKAAAAKGKAHKETPEQNLNPTITEKNIPEVKIKREANNEISFNDPSAPTEPLNIFPQDTKPPSEFSTVQESVTRPSGEISKSEFTGAAYFDEILPEKKKTTTEPLGFLEKEVKVASENNRGKFWLLPAAAIGVSTISGISGIVWLGSSSLNNSSKPSANVSIATPKITPTLNPTIKPSVSPTIEETPQVEETKVIKRKPVVETERQKPTVVSKPTPVVFSTPKKVIRPEKTPNMSDDCIYNGKCG